MRVENNNLFCCEKIRVMTPLREDVNKEREQQTAMVEGF